MRSWKVHDIYEALASGSPLLIGFACLLAAIPIMKIIIEFNTQRHSLRKDRQALFFAAINSSLEKTEGSNASFLNYQLEQTFESYYRKRLHHFEIKKIINTPKPSYFARQYLLAQKFLRMENKKEVPGKIRFKNKPKRYRISLRSWAWRFFPMSILNIFGYFIFSSGGMLLVLKLLPIAIKQGNVPAAIGVAIVGVSSIIFSISFLADAVNFHTALRIRTKNY
jgi:hypothetical protein